MNGLVLVGAGMAAYKISGAYTGKTDKVGEPGVLSDLLTTDATSDVMEKMCGCLNRITTEELYNNRGFSALFGQTGETRKANTYRYLINHNKSNTAGVLNEKSKKELLGQAEKAVQYSRQAEHLFCQIANSNAAQVHLKQAKTHGEDLLYLYTQRDKLISSTVTESAQSSAEKIALLSQQEEKLTIVNARIEKAECSFKQALHAHQEGDDNTLSRVGYKELMREFNLEFKVANRASKYQVEDFIRFYAFKVKLMEDPDGFGQQVRNDIRKYIFSTSVGHLGAGDKLAYQYGKLIANFLDESSLGDVDSRSGNISHYFMQTVYNLLNVGDPTFTLADLCIGKDQPSQALEVPNFAGDNACPGSYYLKDEGVEIVTDIVKYYNELSSIVGKDQSQRLLPPLDPSRKKTLLWNLVGGTHSEHNNKTKKGIFFRIDEQLKGFTSKTESAMHSKLDGFENKSGIFESTPLERFVDNLPKNPYLAADSEQAFQPSYSLGQHPHEAYSERLNVLQRIAARCRLNDLEFPDRQDSAKKNQLRSLKTNYERAIAEADLQPNSVYEVYFKQILGDDLYQKFLQINNVIDRDGHGENNAVEPVDALLTSGWDPISPDLAAECIQSAKSRKEKVKKQEFNMILANAYDVNTHLNTYVGTINNLRNKLNASALYKEMKDIIAGLGNVKDVIKFYNNIKDKTHESKEIGLLVTPTKLVQLAQLAVLDTKDQINQLYERYTQLNEKYGSEQSALDNNDFQNSEREIFEYSFLETLFNFIENQSNAENAEQPNVNVDIILTGAVDACIKKLDSMHYVTLATNTINALNSKRLLLQLTKQKDMLIQFAEVFSIASTEKLAGEELQNLSNSMVTVITDLEARYVKLVEAKDNGKECKKFNELCSQINVWLLQLFINQDKQIISNEFQYVVENNNQHITLTLPKNVAKSCQENYHKLQRANFSSEDWSTVSLVHKTMLENSLDKDKSIVSKMTLYLGQLFSDGFTYNPQTDDITQFQKLLASYQTAVGENLTALNTMGYLNQELLGHYAKLIEGVEQLFAINTTVALRSKLLMAWLDYTANGSKREFVCDLTDKEQKLYLTYLQKSNLYRYPRSSTNPIPVDERGNPDLTNFDLHSPQVFVAPAEVVRQLLAYLNMSNKGDDAEPVEAPLTDYAISTANMVKDIKEKSLELHERLAQGKEELEQLKQGIDQVNAKLKGTETFAINKDTMDSCDELLHYFKLEPQAVSKIDEAQVNVTQVNTLQLADIYNDMFVNLFSRPASVLDVNERAQIKIEFDRAYEEIAKVSLSGDIALFANKSKDGMLNLNENTPLIQAVVKTIKDMTNNELLSTIEQPLDFQMLKNIYKLCSMDRTANEKYQIQSYLNAFQYKKIEQCLAKFYVGASNNLPKLAANLSALYKSAEVLPVTQPAFQESKNDNRARERFIAKSNTHLKNVTNSILEWQSLILEHSDNEWLVRPRYNALESKYKDYFEWFTRTYLKLDIVNSGAVGALRDELQFMVILDYLKVYKGVGDNQIRTADIDLIKRFYHSPQQINNDEFDQIRGALKRVDAFLTWGDDSKSNVINEVFAKITTFMQQISDWFSYKKDVEKVGEIKHDLQQLYDLFYSEIMVRANDTLEKIAFENTKLNRGKEAFTALCAEDELIRLFDPFKNVKTAGELYGLFRLHAENFRAIGKHPRYSDMLKLVIDAVKANNFEDLDLKKVHISFIKKIIDGDYHFSGLSDDDLVKEAEKAESAMTREELGMSFNLT